MSAAYAPWVTWPTIARLAIAYAVLGAMLFALRRRFETISFDAPAAEAKGWRLRWWDFWFYLIFGVVITFSVPLGGVLLVVSFLVVPAVTAFLFTRDPARLTVIAFATGAVASALGLWVSYHSDLPTGPTIVCSYSLVLLLAGLVRKIVPETRPTGRRALPADEVRSVELFGSGSSKAREIG